MSVKKSPTFWEELKQLDCPALKDAFNECAEIDLDWAIDQARCLSWNVSPFSDQAGTIRNFCHEAAREALKSAKIETALAAFEIAADNPVPDEQESAASCIYKLLEEIAADKKDHALGMAVLIKARPGHNEQIASRVIDFILDYMPEDKPLMLMNIVRGRDADRLTASQTDKIIAQTRAAAEHEPYPATLVFRELLNNPERLNAAQKEEISNLQSALEENPEVLKAILKNEYGEDVNAGRHKKKLIYPAPRIIQ